MPFQVPTFEQLRDTYLITVRNQNPAAATGPDSDHYVRACGVAAVAEHLFAHQSWVWRQAFPDLADEDILEKMAAQRGVPRKVEQLASGTVRFTGTPGTVVPVGVTLTTTVASYTTTAAVNIGVGGTVDAPGDATQPGVAGNVSEITAAVLSGAPGGVATGQVVNMTGGSDRETAAALLERLLVVLSQPAQGGNRNDYIAWALAVPGVRRAFVFPLRRGYGTVDLVPMPETGLPAAELLAAVQTAIDALKPVGMGVDGFLALAPTPVPVDIIGTLTLDAGKSLAEVLPQIESGLARVFYDTEPGETLHLARIVATIVNVPGVRDVELTSPTANITPEVSSFVVEMVELGVINLGT
jgi:uncharacterized phage protein gp47/JayE